MKEDARASAECFWRPTMMISRHRTLHGGTISFEEELFVGMGIRVPAANLDGCKAGRAGT